MTVSLAERRRINSKTYRERHHDDRFICECGDSIRIVNKYRHNQSVYHIKIMSRFINK